MKKRLDNLDLESIDTLRRSRGWKLVQDRLAHSLSIARERLEKNQSEVETAEVRGEIRALRVALGIPDILLREGKAHHELSGSPKED